ncbi:hypothetical protein EV356DRAFT_547969 [Viridothelium virens]|uniref:WW domain-containing protein n=1 Tax=Viridothelium virens TaxID=1048519 RepID=A0A6A6H6B4_VIRVR|nr:hypothetical protein EV356DRAFT_547969 [Viridothelium virens]
MTLQSQLEGANHKPNFATTQLYHHSPLPDPTSCVRLIDLLPGNFNDEIQLLIFQVPLKEYDIRQGTVLSLDELKDTLPLGWVAKKTVEGRYLFKPKNTKRWQWAHPNPSFDEAQYVIPEFRNSQSALLQPWLEYEALSYTWGSKADTEIKSSQIRRIGIIFKLAYRVIAFVGQEERGTSRALDSLQCWGEQWEILMPNLRVRSPDVIINDTIIERWDEQTWADIAQFLKRKWFTRLWIMQESHLANGRAIIQCGQRTILLSVFRRALRCLQIQDWLPSKELRLQLGYTTKMTYYSSTLPFRAVLELGRDRVCSDPRDKVYGLLGLVSAPFAADIVPSYIQKVEDVYRETCLTYLSRFKRLDLLKSCYQTGRTLDLPSWSPDLQSDIPVDIFNPFQFATGCSRAHFTYTAPNILEVFGLTCAVLDKVSTPLSKTAVDPLNVIRSWQPEDAARSTYMTGESLSIAFAITLRMNRVKERFPKVRYTLDEWLARCFQTGLLGVDNEVAFANDDKEIQSFDGRAIDICTGRTFVRTREGYVGLAPCDAQQGDVIVVLLGCDSPVLLRKQPG